MIGHPTTDPLCQYGQVRDRFAVVVVGIDVSELSLVHVTTGNCWQGRRITASLRGSAAEAKVPSQTAVGVAVGADRLSALVDVAEAYFVWHVWR
jgi:hypothetical protein